MINSYDFTDALSDILTEGDIIVTGVGTSYTGTHQCIRLKKNQRFISNIGCGGMGYGLPAAIGAAIGSKKRVILLDGDGGFMMNIQELQTIVHHNLPLKMFILNNQGYLAIRITQTTYFKRLGGIDKKTGVSFPDFKKVAFAFGIPFVRITSPKTMKQGIKKTLAIRGPVLCEIMMPKNQKLRTFSKSLYKQETKASRA